MNTTCSDTCTRDPLHDGPHQNNKLSPIVEFDMTFDKGDVIHFVGSSEAYVTVVDVRIGHYVFCGQSPTGVQSTYYKNIQPVLCDSAQSPWRHGKQPRRCRRWTDKERLQAIRLASWGWSAEEIGGIIDRTPRAVTVELQRQGFNTRVWRKATNLR